MKKQLILGGLLAIAGALEAQPWVGTSPTSNAYRSFLTGIGTSSPSDWLHVVTTTANSGISITQNGSESARLLLQNTTSGGRAFSLYSTGLSSAQGAGNFLVYDHTSLQTRFLIQGTTGNVGIGGITSPSYRMDISTNSASNDGLRITHSGGSEASIFLNNTFTPGTSKNWSLRSHTSGEFSLLNVSDNISALNVSPAGNIGMGVSGTSNKLEVNCSIPNNKAIYAINTTGSSAFGVSGAALGSIFNVNNIAMGIRGQGQNAYKSYGGYFEAVPTGFCAGGNFGIWATVNTGVTPCANDYAGYFDGNVSINGTTYSSLGYTSSDRKLKKDISSLTNGIDKIRLLKPSTYTFRTDEFTTMNLPTEKQIGLIAQELEEVLPNLVTEVAATDRIDSEGKMAGTIPSHKAINYTGLIPVLIAAVQEQDKTIQSQQQQLDEQKALIDQLLQKTNTSTGINTANPGANNYSMSQNEPNPFNNETVIRYTLPQQVNAASLIVYDLTGKQIASFPVTEKGTSSITITSEKLAAGIYIYSIVADGKIVDSKRMIVAEK